MSKSSGASRTTTATTTTTTEEEQINVLQMIGEVFTTEEKRAQTWLNLKAFKTRRIFTEKNKAGKKTSRF